MKIYIYALKHPITDEIKYIGKTNNVKRRLQGHIDCAKSIKKKRRYISYWILKLAKDNLKPILIILEECSELNWKEREKYWICFYKDLGCSLCNLTEGGEGTHGYKYPKYLKELRKQARIGYIISEETKIKISKSLEKKLKCIETSEQFDSLKHLATVLNLPKSTLCRKIKNKQKINNYFYEYI